MTTRKIQRNSKQRQVILEELRKSHSHPTASELYAKVRKQLPRISLGTVYRNLDLLEKQGQIRKMWTSGKEARFDGNCHEHYHIRCVRCGKIDDLHDLSAQPIAADLENVAGYRILGHQLEFTGLCPECKDKEKNDVTTDHSY
jgi:Fur family ferric uptake transcriptional regulator